jgi:transposase-like protein
MSGHPKISVELRRQVIARYAKLANATRVAKEFGISDMTVSRIVRQMRELDRDKLHERATRQGIREGRKSIRKAADRVSRWIEKLGDPDAPGMEPADLARLTQSLRSLIGGLNEIEQRNEQHKLSRLTRELRRKEIEIAKLKIANGGIEKHEVSVAPDDAREALAAVLATRGRGDEPK